MAPATIPPPSTNDVYLFGEKGVGRPHYGPDVEVVLPVLNRDVEVVPLGIKVGHDRLVLPVAILVHHIAAVTIPQQVRVPVLAHRPLALPRPDADLGFRFRLTFRCGFGRRGQGVIGGGRSVTPQL